MVGGFVFTSGEVDDYIYEHLHPTIQALVRSLPIWRTVDWVFHPF